MLKKSNWKPSYITKSSLLEIYRNRINNILKKSGKIPKKRIKYRFWDRDSIITSNLKDYKKIKIRVGNGWKNLRINDWNVGFKFGEFSWNRKPWRKRLKRRPPKPKRR